MTNRAEARVRYADRSWQSKLAHADVDWLTPGPPDNVTLVKENALRRVYRLIHPRATLYVKQHFRRGTVQRLKDLFRGSPAKIEFRAGRYAIEHDVHAVNIVAWAERRDDWSPHLSMTASVAIEGAHTLADAFDKATAVADPRTRKTAVDALITGVARMLASAHDAAFLHPDGHPGNILVRALADGSVECIYVDVYGARFGRMVTEGEAAKNLAVLDQWFDRRASRPEKLRLVKTYLAGRHKATDREAFHRFVRLVTTCARRQAHALYRKRDRRIGRCNAYFAALRLVDGWRAVLTLRFRNLARLVPVAVPQRGRQEWKRNLTAYAQGRREGSGHRANGEAFVAESFFAEAWSTALAWRLLGSPAWQRYKTACWALNRDIPAAAGLASLACRGAGTVEQARWLMLRPAAGKPLLRWLGTCRGPQRRRVLEQVGRLVAETTRKGLALRGLEASRLEVAPVAPQSWSVYWVGVEGKALSRPASEHVAAYMLTDLERSVRRAPVVTRTDRARVLRAYCRRAGKIRGTDDWKTLWHRLSETASGA